MNRSTKIITEILRYLLSICVVGFSGFIIVYGILKRESGFSRTFPTAHPVLCLFVFIFLILFFGLLEGGHVCVVDVSKHSNETFKEKYKGAAATHSYFYGRRIRNVGKYLMGRQVMVIFTQFFLGSLVAFPGMTYFPFTDHKFPTLFKLIFVDTGLLNVTFVTWIGSLVPQLIATRYPVQFLNIIPIKVIVIAGLVIEASGVAHFSWVLHNVIAHIFKMDKGVTARVMANGSLEDEETAHNKAVQLNQVTSENYWNKQNQEYQRYTGEWKSVQEVASEWEQLGFTTPAVFRSGTQQNAIGSILNLVQRDPQLANTMHRIVFAN